jgi:DeoR/GlpR family transcriptional regulator of sugar metabolism
MNLKSQILELNQKGIKVPEIARQLNVSKTTIFYHLNPRYKQLMLERGKKHFQSLSREQRDKYNESRREYNKDYQSKRYKNDLVFREKTKERARNRRKHGV